MSSAEATVDDTVAMAQTVRNRELTVLTAIAVAQLTWLGALAYGVISLLT
jgi:hypothetical protein